MQSLADRLGLNGNGFVVLTCPKCGAHTAGKPPVVCWVCRPRAYVTSAARHADGLPPIPIKDPHAPPHR